MAACPPGAGLVVSGAKDPARVESGRRGALKRWGNPENRRRVRLDELDPTVANVIRALVAADKAAKASQETQKAAPSNTASNDGAAKAHGVGDEPQRA